MTFKKKPNSPDIWNKKPVASSKTHDLPDDEIIVKVQSMFPNCQKYEPCCKESGTEEMMEKVKHIANYNEMIKDILEDAKIDT